MLYRIFYVSRCNIQNKFDAKNIVDVIVKNANIKNKAHNITGAMTFDGNDFSQILEGEKNAVKKLFETIKADQRHENIILLKEQEIVDRHYPDWGMKKLDSSNYDELVKVMA